MYKLSDKLFLLKDTSVIYNTGKLYVENYKQTFFIVSWNNTMLKLIACFKLLQNSHRIYIQHLLQNLRQLVLTQPLYCVSEHTLVPYWSQFGMVSLHSPVRTVPPPVRGLVPLVKKEQVKG